MAVPRKDVAEKQAGRTVEAARPKAPVPRARPVPAVRTVDGVPDSLAFPSKDGKAVRFRLADSRSETGAGYLSVDGSAVSRTPEGLSVRLDGRSVYGIVEGGKLSVLGDPGDVAGRLERAAREARLAGRRHRAEALEAPVPSADRGKDDASWQMR